MVNEYMSAEQAAAESPYASAPAEGSASWYSAEIASREAEAAANTMSSPSGDSGMTNGGFYQDPRTGDMYANYTQFLSQNPTGVSVDVWSTPGVSVTTPSGEIFESRYSQYWMDPGYTGQEPSLAEKAAYSSAEYAAAFAGTLMSQYDQTAVSPAAKVIATTYPKLATTPVTTKTIAEQFADLTGDTGIDVSGAIDWLKNNFLIVVIVVSAVFVLPRVLPAPARGR